VFHVIGDAQEETQVLVDEGTLVTMWLLGLLMKMEDQVMPCIIQ